MKKIDQAIEIFNHNFNQENPLEAREYILQTLQETLNITRGNATIYFSKALSRSLPEFEMPAITRAKRVTSESDHQIEGEQTLYSIIQPMKDSWKRECSNFTIEEANRKLDAMNEVNRAKKRARAFLVAFAPKEGAYTLDQLKEQKVAFSG